MLLSPLPSAISTFRLAKSLGIATLALIILCGTAFGHAGSVYVPIDSWTYPATERLAALINSQTDVLGMRPWTRSQFARYLERARTVPHSGDSQELQSVLEHEFAPEMDAVAETKTLESLYSRSTQIAGVPLRDSYHFGQTIADDFGRPYGDGFNSVSGASGYLQHGAGMLYVRGEYQHGASLGTPSESAIVVLATVDQIYPDQVLTQGGHGVNQFRLLDAYTGVSFGNWTGTLGKQSLWWGPATGGAFLESNNAEPIWMARLTNDLPYRIPILGKTRIDLFYGKLQGHEVITEPWIHGEKISFQPFNNFEIGFSRTVVFLGTGRPLTFNRLWRSYFVSGSGKHCLDCDTAQNDPGDRRAGLDFSWKLPKIPVTLYSDGFSDDEPSPLASQTRSAFRPGLFFARFPGALAKLDLRLEGSYTASENSTIPHGYNYWNSIYKDGYTNKGLLIGDTVGRDGVSWQAWSNYWISPRRKVQVSYRNSYISPKFLKGGGTQNTVRTSSSFLVKQTTEIELGTQTERVVIPLLSGTRTAQYNVIGWVGVKYWPEHKVK